MYFEPFARSVFLRYRQLNFLLYGRIILGQSVSKITIIILSFRVSTSKNKNADHRVEETCAIWSIQVTYETDQISLLRDSTMSNALNFCFLSILL